MHTYARIDAGAVAELLTTDATPASLFHPALVWVDVTGEPVAEGWLQTPGGFVPSPSER